MKFLLKGCPCQFSGEYLYWMWPFCHQFQREQQVHLDHFPSTNTIPRIGETTTWIVTTPWKISMEPKNLPIEKEHHLPSTSIFGFHVAPPKKQTDMTMEKPQLKDVFPIKNGDFPVSYIFIYFPGCTSRVLRMCSIKISQPHNAPRPLKDPKRFHPRPSQRPPPPHLPVIFPTGTPLTINMKRNHGGLVQMIFLSKWVIRGFHVNLPGCFSGKCSHLQMWCSKAQGWLSVSPIYPVLCLSRNPRFATSWTETPLLEKQGHNG